MPKTIAPKTSQKSIFGDIGSVLGKAGGEFLGKALGFRKGGKVMKRERSESPKPMKRGGRAHMVKGSKAAKAYMAKLRAMRK
jgi:hypothetical protein